MPFKNSNSAILVVDDEVHIVQYLTKVLSRNNYKILPAYTGRQGLQLFQENEIALVIADVNMPDLSGLDLLVEIKKRNAQIPVINITGMATVDTAIKCMKSGAVDYISKPFRVQEILDSVEKALEIAAQSLSDMFKTVENCSHDDFMFGYEVLAHLGEGNMGIVYLVEKRVNGESKRFALKVLKMLDIDDHENKRLRQRFLNEAKVLSRLDHPNIVKVFEYGVDDESLNNYIVMEYLDGAPLSKSRARIQQLSCKDKSRIVHQAADAMSAIHGLGVLHRDIKPSNMMIDKNFNLKLTDFGIAKMPDSELTRKSDLLGSPGYMSPEAFRSSEVDCRADIFSLGSMAYEIYLGVRPFKGDSVFRLSHLIQFEEPTKPNEMNADFPQEIERILDKMLKKNPAERYGSMQEVCVDLGSYINFD
jgi:eukaryotic-like serine/threonine-protein kinase